MEIDGDGSQGLVPYLQRPSNKDFESILDNGCNLQALALLARQASMEISEPYVQSNVTLDQTVFAKDATAVYDKYAECLVQASRFLGVEPPAKKIRMFLLKADDCEDWAYFLGGNNPSVTVYTNLVLIEALPYILAHETVHHVQYENSLLSPYYRHEQLVEGIAQSIGFRIALNIASNDSSAIAYVRQHRLDLFCSVLANKKFEPLDLLGTPLNELMFEDRRPDYSRGFCVIELAIKRFGIGIFRDFALKRFSPIYALMQA